MAWQAGLAGATPLVPVRSEAMQRAGAELWLKREDLRDPLLGGNKWHKLRGHLAEAQRKGSSCLLSFGGAWSNHLHALAAAGACFGFATVGVVRGGVESAMIEDCRRFGMRIVAVGYEEYRDRNELDWVHRLIEAQGLPDCHIIPEGGGGSLGMRGFAELAAELEGDAAGQSWILALAMGTGTTLAGLAAHLPASVRIWGFPVLPLPGIEQKLAEWVQPYAGHAAYTVWHGVVDRGYGRLKPEWRDFLADFEQRHRIPLDPIYTVKLLWALDGLAEQECIPQGSKIVALHSGGLQGRRGFGLPPLLVA